ncbi:MAG: hypothetical protein ACK2UO_13295 [Caldilineaceae bacterium]|jgi:ABC-type multidrug transport system permease subunit
MNEQIGVLAGWLGFAGGALSGAVIGVRFHEDGWAGGYSSFRRRLLRLGHIAFFGIGLLNIALAYSVTVLALPSSIVFVAVTAMVVAGIGMPLTCFLTAWRKPFRHLFPIPVAAVMISAGLVLAGWAMS